jgi:Pentapeptide repeats (8 copies)
VRLGGIYALERIAHDSPRDHWTIVEVLTAYVRQNAPAPSPSSTNRDELGEEAYYSLLDSIRPSVDVQAVLTVLGRRQRGPGREEPRILDLSRTDLRGADVHDAHFENVLLFETLLDGANLIGAHFEGAHFIVTSLVHARVEGTHFEGAQFSGTHLFNVDLGKAYVAGAAFFSVWDLTPEQLSIAADHGASVSAEVVEP